MRGVIDTNVLLSGLLWHGTCAAQSCSSGNIELVLSQALLDELADVIARQRFAAILQRTTCTPERILSEIQTLAEIVVAPPLSLPMCRDPDDDAVLACALAAHADLIVSGDNDLLVLKEFLRMPIITAAQAMQRLERQA